MGNKNKLRALVLVTDAFGGRGGIALYNRYLLKCLCEYSEMNTVVALPRKIFYKMEKMPSNLEYLVSAAGGKLRYVFNCIRISITNSKFDIIFCTHLYLLPLAWLLGLRYRCQVIPVIYGRDAWAATPYRFTNYLCGKLKTFISIRHLTARRFIEWAKIPHKNYYYLPNCIDSSQYGVSLPNPDLLARYGLNGKIVILTSGRLDTGADLNKGFDEVIESLPELRKKINNIAYVIMGDGDDKLRLEAKAMAFGVNDITVFTGYVSEAEKADHYRLAHAFVMPGSNPEFDRYPYRFVFLEALACGVPVVGAVLEDEWEIHDPDTSMIIQVDPADKLQIIDGILKALSQSKGVITPTLKKYYYEGFREQLHRIIGKILLKSNGHVH